jgi:hypothetical protein
VSSRSALLNPRLIAANLSGCSENRVFKQSLSRNDAAQGRSGFQPDPQGVEERGDLIPSKGYTVERCRTDFVDRLEACPTSSFVASALFPN